MFAEEESRVNATKKRQEQARERRKKLKEQQDKKKKKKKEQEQQLLKQQQQQQQQQQEQEQEQQEENKGDGAGNGVKGGNDSAGVGVTNISSSTTSTSTSSNVNVNVPNGIPSTNVTSTNVTNDAVAKALQQRTLRSRLKHQTSSAIIIQSAVRAHLSNQRLYKHQWNMLQTRTSDLMKLTWLLLEKQKEKEKQKNDSGNDNGNGNNNQYVPPPSLINAMVNQMLFVFSPTPRYTYTYTSYTKDKDTTTTTTTTRNHTRTTTRTTRTRTRTNQNNIRNDLTAEHAKLISNMVQYAILPGILSQNVHLDILIPWMQMQMQMKMNIGQCKLKKLLRLLCHVMLARETRKTHIPKGNAKRGAGTGGSVPAAVVSTTRLIASEDDVKVIYKFFRVLVDTYSTVNDHDTVRRKFCRDLLLQQQVQLPSSLPLPSASTSTSTSDLDSDSDLDLITQLRSFLLYPSKKKNISVIPTNAEQKGEQCMDVHDVNRGDGLFRLIMELLSLSSSSSSSSSSSILLQSRFVVEIMTVPLLTWKIGKDTLSDFVRVRDNEQPPIFVTFLQAFMKRHGMSLSSGSGSGSDVGDVGDTSRNIASIFPTHDVPLSLCASPPILNLFANVIQCGVRSPNIHTSDPNALDYEAATTFFQLTSILCNEVPLAAFSSRESELEWLISGDTGSHLTPVVISSVVRNQCQPLVQDTFLRQIVNHAIELNVNIDVNVMDNMLARKDSKDKKIDEDMASLQKNSAVEVAAKEVNEKKGGFWQNSRWARKLSKKVSSVFSNEKKSETGHRYHTSTVVGGGVLMNTSSISREFATGGGTMISEKMKRKVGKEQEVKKGKIRKDLNHRLLFAITRTYAIAISRWGGGGAFRVNGADATKVDRPSTTNGSKTDKNHTRGQARDKIEPCIMSVLNVLCFSTPFIKASWVLIQSDPLIVSDLQKLVDPTKRHMPIQATGLNASFMGGQLSFNDNIGPAFLLMFNKLLAHALIVTDDVELHDMDQPIPLHHIRRCIVLLKNVLRRACCVDKNGSAPNHVGLSLISSSAKVMRDLYDRSSRRLLCPPKVWIIDDLLDDEIHRCKYYEDYHALLGTPVLRLCPFLVPFKRRLKLFEQIVSTNRISIQGRNDGHSFRPGVTVHIMRGRVLEDGLTHLNKLGPNLRRRIIVQYVNSAGATEAGLDAGGLFKEFWTDLSNQSFDPNWALFLQTEDSNGYLFPNPSSRAAHGSDSIILFEFLGRILGKAIFENITIQPQFAHFFLSFLRGDYNFLHMLPDLSTMDRTLYNNLMFLKTYEGDASDLCLTFSVTKDDFGTNKEVALIPNGGNLDVTNANKHRYIQLVAKHFVCDQMREQSEAFRRGLWDVIDRSWLSIFNEPELQVLISGSTDGEIDVDDLKANSHYAGGYTMFDRNIIRFWKVIKSFSKEQRADLLRFVTSCERPPPLGFGSMTPPFTIQRIAISNDNEKLPTASTCFNVLKLPTYSSEKVQKQKLLYAIKSQSGFELT